MTAGHSTAFARCLSYPQRKQVRIAEVTVRGDVNGAVECAPAVLFLDPPALHPYTFAFLCTLTVCMGKLCVLVIALACSPADSTCCETVTASANVNLCNRGSPRHQNDDVNFIIVNYKQL